MKIEKDMKVFSIIIKNIKSIEIFKKYNMECFLCNGAHDETLEVAAKANGVDVDMLIDELNNI
ncbi:DUF1858 domain-containing protein [Dethiothermospora halolimnae]|uniref:DUF1858 domain-containing protein n=1 Tax=Dethiothermospora halolimnae TaxID=3114390 RepID=UPI003CCB9732